MKIGSLFTGGGMGDFGFMAAGMEIAWQVEIDDYCQKILALRYPESKKYCDIKTLKGDDLEKVDIITGGFPCQPFSTAGKRGGTDDNRYLWPEMLRVIKECRPRWVVGENVPGILDMALHTVCADLEEEGYETWPIVFPSHALGAPHKRDRLWIVAHCGHNRRCTQQEQQQEERSEVVANGKRPGSWPEQARRPEFSDSRSNVANAGCEYVKGNTGELESDKAKWSASKLSLESGCEGFRRLWAIEPQVGRVAHGVSRRVDRLKLLGNGQVPVCTYVIGKMIMEIDKEVAQQKFI